MLNRLLRRQPRVFAIGDIHGCNTALIALLKAINPQPFDTIVFLGDYVDRGLDSKGVLDTVIDLKSQCQVITLCGNHESMMQLSFGSDDPDARLKMAEMWYKNGGASTLVSYMFNLEDLFAQDIRDIHIPASLKEHLSLIDTMPLYYETDTHIFVHATPEPNTPIEDQDELSLIWRRAGRLELKHGYTHISGKTIVSGHTAQASGLPLYLSDKNIIIDSACVFDGWLTAMDVGSGRCIQSNNSGGIRQL